MLGTLYCACILFSGDGSDLIFPTDVMRSCFQKRFLNKGQVLEEDVLYLQNSQILNFLQRSWRAGVLSRTKLHASVKDTIDLWRSQCILLQKKQKLLCYTERFCILALICPAKEIIIYCTIEERILFVHKTRSNAHTSVASLASWTWEWKIFP